MRTTQPTINIASRDALSTHAAAVFDRVLEAMQDAEEMGGPEDYGALMAVIAQEAMTRIVNHSNVRGDEAFDRLFRDAYAGLREYHPSRLTAEAEKAIRSAVRPIFKPTGDAQRDYESIRDAIESHVNQVHADQQENA